MRTHSEPKNILADGIHVNMILSFVYIGSYGAGMHGACLAAFISIVLNSIYMISVLHMTIPEDEAEEAEEAEDEEDEEEDEAEEDDGTEEAEVDVNLSLKQREHGATLTKSLSEEDDAVLYEKLYQIVEETKRRNEERSRCLVRTPTSSSLANPACEDDEYADMPPLIYTNTLPRQNPVLRNRRANIFDYNTLHPTDEYSDMPALEPHPHYIPNIKEILEASRSSILHDSLEHVD